MINHTDYEIMVASPKALDKIAMHSPKDAALAIKPNAKYPIDLLEIGECFHVGIMETSHANLNGCAKENKKRTGKKFCVLTHRDIGVFEVARIA